MHAAGMTEEAMLADQPDLTPDDIRVCLAFAADRERGVAGGVPSPLILELHTVAPELAPRLESAFEARDAVATLPDLLRDNIPLEHLGDLWAQRTWEISGLLFLNSGRTHEALGVFFEFYDRMLEAQSSLGRLHKGTVLVWIGECFERLGFPTHAKRYLMLTLCEDALLGDGTVPAETSGVYFRLVWRHGLPHNELVNYASIFSSLAAKAPADAFFPEALLQEVDDGWSTELPAPQEAFLYRVNRRYVRHLLAKMDDGTGQALERLAQYLMACMPGCRARRRQRTYSTDFDVVCSMEGFDIDFRSELGRHFVCECKDWISPAGFSTMAKFCRVLDSTKSRFGILFSKSGISGTGEAVNAEREQLKVFQDRGVVIVVLDLSDLEKIADGRNLIVLLRERYEGVRLDLRSASGGR